MSRHDDNAARQVDDLVTELQGGPGAGRDDVAYLFAVSDEIGDAAELLQADADRTGHVPPDVARLRTRVLEGAAAHDRRHRRARLPRKARSFNRSFMQRVLAPTMAIMFFVVATTALGHTDTSVGSAVRTAARTLKLPTPAEPQRERAPRERPQEQSSPATVDGDPETGEVDPKLIAPPTQAQPRSAQPGNEPVDAIPPVDVPPLDGADAPKLPPLVGEHLLPPPDGSKLPPPDGSKLPPPDGSKLPPPDGSKLPPPAGEPLPPKH